MPPIVAILILMETNETAQPLPSLTETLPTPDRAISTEVKAT